MTKPIFLISACLAGVHCRYDGNNVLIPEMRKLVEQGLALPICPEVLGGLQVPRESCELRLDSAGGAAARVVSRSGLDLTREFELGAWRTLAISRHFNLKAAILKDRSPSCGFGQIYDGTFTGQVRPGDGITARLLADAGLKIFVFVTPR